MTQTATQFSPTHEFNVDEQLILRVLESLRHWTTLNQGHQNEKRTTERMDFFGNPFVVLEAPLNPDDPQPRSVSFRVWGRDLSRSGMSFVIAPTAQPVHPTENSQVTQLDSVLKSCAEVTVGLGQSGGGALWLKAQVLRVRPVHDGLFECGVGFLRRIESPPV